MKDLYKILGVAESADAAAIKKAYRKLAKELHPDVTGSDKKKTERFKEINEAYAVLGDDEKRKEYDRLKHAPVRPDGMPEGFDAEEFASRRAASSSATSTSATSSPACSAGRRADVDPRTRSDGAARGSSGRRAAATSRGRW